jgi:hypothetical protein
LQAVWTHAPQREPRAFRIHSALRFYLPLTKADPGAPTAPSSRIDPDRRRKRFELGDRLAHV